MNCVYIWGAAGLPYFLVMPWKVQIFMDCKAREGWFVLDPLPLRRISIAFSSITVPFPSSLQFNHGPLLLFGSSWYVLDPRGTFCSIHVCSVWHVAVTNPLATSRGAFCICSGWQTAVCDMQQLVCSIRSPDFNLRGALIE